MLWIDALCAAHHFLCCAVALDLWSMVLCLFGKRTTGEIWKVVPLFIMLCFWRERNARCFGAKELHMTQLNKLRLLILFLQWTSQSLWIHRVFINLYLHVTFVLGFSFVFFPYTRVVPLLRFYFNGFLLLIKMWMPILNYKSAFWNEK